MRRIGPDVNLGNIPSTALLGLETIRLGLRADTLECFESAVVVRESRDVFHLAIPVYDLDEAEAFYVGALGCKLARRYADRITIDFFGDQLVCHLTERPGRVPARAAASTRGTSASRSARRATSMRCTSCACSARSSSSPT